MSNKISTEFNEIGGKAHGLNILMQMGYRVPEYFVVSFNQDINSPELVEQVNKFAAQFSKVAVRSSANIEDGEKSSFAGQFSSYLDVPVTETISRIEDVRKSAKTDHVKSYCKAMGLSVEDVMVWIIQNYAGA